MTLLSEILDYNEQFVADKKYEAFTTTKFPDKKMVIFGCMDTRLVELMPKSMNLKNGDVKIVKNAGATVSHPFGSIMRSILVAVYELQADEVFVVGHYDCGMAAIKSDATLQKMLDRGIPQETIDTLTYSGIDPKEFLKGFDSPEDNVLNSVNMIRNHPLMDPKIPVHGLIINPESGKLDLLVDGYSK
ncbi:beta-class carbonic anhydrase [Falsibacillus albus]|uniref:carbonic anhydrase n=1 Tax=Falsibacillus albus TaxID=2478915 RepID=A0A3L7JQI8_9BACI|nr:carbonic anhydrase [Falsibacillus albus]RLQ93088.1 carbonic anhydrase [Falsibacillus albus]